MSQYSTIQIGDARIRNIGEKNTFDPSLGFVDATVFECDYEPLLAFQRQLARANHRSDIYIHNPPLYRMDVIWSGQRAGEALVAVDKWEWETDYAQESIYSNPNVLAAAGDDESLAEWQEVFKGGLKDSKAPSVIRSELITKGFAAEEADAAMELYTLLMRGQDAVEVERTVLRRTRTFPLAFAEKVVLDRIPKIYTTKGLVQHFNIPSGIRNQMPANPGTPPLYTVWGWKVRKDNSVIIPTNNRIEENKDFVFAAWARMTYTIVGATGEQV